MRRIEVEDFTKMARMAARGHGSQIRAVARSARGCRLGSLGAAALILAALAAPTLSWAAPAKRAAQVAPQAAAPAPPPAPARLDPIRGEATFSNAGGYAR